MPECRLSDSAATVPRMQGTFHVEHWRTLARNMHSTDHAITNHANCTSTAHYLHTPPRQASRLLKGPGRAYTPQGMSYPSSWRCY